MYCTKTTMLPENRPHLSVTKHGYTSKSNLLKVFQCTLNRLKTSFRWQIMRKKSRLLLYVSYVLMSEWTYSCQNTISRTINSFTCPLVNSSTIVNFLVGNLTLKVAFLSTNCPPCRKKIDSREGLFWCKKGVVCVCGKMNFYLIRPLFAPVLGSFPAKFSAFWCKTRCILVQNTK